VSTGSSSESAAAAGKLHIIGYNIDRQPYLQYGVLSPNGSLIKSFPINVPFPSMFHGGCGVLLIML
jgi:carotenoid cleavage dioxygenase-like enzyme